MNAQQRTPFVGPLAPNQVELVYVPMSCASPTKYAVVTARILKRLIVVEICGYGEQRFNRETGRSCNPKLKYAYSIGRAP